MGEQKIDQKMTFSLTPTLKL